MTPARTRLVTALVLAGAVAFAYGGSLAAWFRPIDDPIHLSAAHLGIAPSPHFRPLHVLWNRVLLALFGERVLLWRLAGLSLHLANGFLVAALARWLGASRPAATLGALAFLVALAPHETPTWIASWNGLLSVSFVLACAVAWTRWIDTGSRGWYAASFAAMVLATGSKEDCVFAGPLLVGLEVARRGWRETLRPARLAAYAPFVALAGVYFLVAFHPDLWRERPGVGAYGLDSLRPGRVAANLAIPFWPRTVPQDAYPAWMPLAGLGLILLVVATARADRRARPMLLLGMVVVLAGLLPVLPGPMAAVAASRYSYPSAVGVGLVVAGFATTFLGGASRPRTARAWLEAALLVAFVGAHALSLRSTVEWRVVRPSLRFRALVESTREDVLGTLRERPGATALLVAPGVWNPLDFECAVLFFLRDEGVEIARTDLSVEGLERQLAPAFEDGDRARWCVFARLDGARWTELDRAADACGSRELRTRP